MNWPRLGDYQEAIQHPASCFRDEDLKAGSVELSGELPRAMSGDFVTVYVISQGQRRWAVRCFSHKVTEHQERYTHLSSYLPTLELPYLAGFEYQDKGIFVNGDWYPIVKMEWCSGKTLHRYIEEHLSQPKVLLSLSERWRRMINELQRNGISHGDLQNENVLVSDDDIKLVDYDAMFVPSLMGRASLERGHNNFQHPKRSLYFYNERVDDFASLVIYTSLRALSVSPSLWATYHGGDNLIFTAKDYSDVSRSTIWGELEKIGNRSVRELTEQLRYFSCVNVDQVGRFEKVVSDTTSRSSFPKSFSLPPTANAVIIEYSEVVESDPQHSWSKRITLFGSGEIQGMYVMGDMPPVLKNLESDTFAHEYIFVKSGRLCLRTGNELQEEWVHYDGSRGKLRMFRAEAAKENISAMMHRLYNEKIDLLPDEIGVMHTGAPQGSLIYNCLINGRPRRKEISFFSHDVGQLLIERYNECASSVKESLLDLVGELGREDRWEDLPQVVQEEPVTETTASTSVVEAVAGAVPTVHYENRPPILTVPITLTLLSGIGFVVTSSIFIDSGTLFYGGAGLLVILSIVVILRILLALKKGM